MLRNFLVGRIARETVGILHMTLVIYNYDNTATNEYRKYSRLTKSLDPVRSINGCPFSRLHVILGSGLPVAWHESVAFSPSISVRSALDSSVIMSGGTGTRDAKLLTKRNVQLYRHRSLRSIGVLVINL